MPNDKKIINLGAGEKSHPDAINIDIYNGKGIQVVCDVKHGIPFDNKEVDEVRAEYFLQQILENEKFLFVMNEVWRVLKPGGIFKFTVPNAQYQTAFKDPFDCRYFVKETFDYFNQDHRRYKYYQGYGFEPWKIISLEEIAGPNDQLKDRFSVVMQKP